MSVGHEDTPIRVAVLQLWPKHKQNQLNLATFDRLLAEVKPGTVDILLLPEMATPGYPLTAEYAKDHVESAKDGPTAIWAQETARRLQTAVFVGFAERDDADGRCYNSLHSFDKDGKALLTPVYRKHFLWPDDESWATPGPEFRSFDLPFRGSSLKIVPSICMDINAKTLAELGTSRDKKELGEYAATVDADIVFIAHNWLDGGDLKADEKAGWASYPKRFDWWQARFQQHWGSGAALIYANRIGTEPGMSFSGSSAVIKLDDKPVVLKHLNPIEEGVLIVEVPRRKKREHRA